MVFTVSASTPFVMLPSSEETPTNMVRTIPNIQTTVVFMYFESLSIWTLSDTFEITLNATDIRLAGTSTTFIKLPINDIIHKMIGCSIPADAIFPVVIISVINNGIKQFVNATKLSIDVFTMLIISEKFFITIVTIKIYVM